MEHEQLKHSFPPLVGERPRVLILGSLPGEESLRRHEYYAYRHNAFWPIMAELLGFDRELPYPERAARLTAAGVALWDSIGSARRPGSLDTAIRDIAHNPIAQLVAEHPTLRLICCNGAKSYGELRRGSPGLFEQEKLDVRRMPSTSPAAAAIPFADKRAAWRIILDFL